jgi:hypothetical protein
MEYKRYLGTVECDDEAKIFHGDIMKGINTAGQALYPPPGLPVPIEISKNTMFL